LRQTPEAISCMKTWDTSSRAFTKKTKRDGWVFGAR
jgi:hypothetical protein